MDAAEQYNFSETAPHLNIKTDFPPTSIINLLYA